MHSWQEIVKNYIVRNSNRIGKATRPLSDHFGIDYFTYHRIDLAGNYTVLVDSPSWAESYVENQLYLNDPYLRHPSVYQSGLCLVDTNGSVEYQEKLMKMGKQVLDVDLGAIVIEKTKEGVEFYGFAANKKRSALENLYLNHPNLLRSFAGHFKKELGDLMNEMGSLLELKGEDFLKEEPVGPKISSEKRLAYYKDLGLLKGVEKLTPRERQCLKWLVEEKSAKETAALLGLSARTVEFYFENIKNKLHCWSKQEVLKIARILNDAGLLS
jgi:DNA-binding CsgD family transcriptional regulator